MASFGLGVESLAVGRSVNRTPSPRRGGPELALGEVRERFRASRHRLSFLLLIAGVAALVVACSRSGRSAFVPPNSSAAPPATLALPAGHLVYVPAIQDYTGARHLLLNLRNADGSGDRGLDGNLDGTDASLSVLPGTQRLVYPVCESALDGSTCHPRIRDIATGDVTDVATAHPARSVSVSPDGRLLAYTSGSGMSEPDGEAALFVSNLDGSDERRIFSYPRRDTSVYSVVWSPDGGSIAFVAGAASADPVIALDDKDAYVVSLRGGPPRQVGLLRPSCDPLNTPDAPGCLATPGPRTTVDRVVWSADGSALILSERTADASGDLQMVASTGERLPQSSLFAGLCHPGKYPGICMLTYVFHGGQLALLRLGGANLQLVSLTHPAAPLIEYRLTNLYSVSNAAWLPPSA